MKRLLRISGAREDRLRLVLGLIPLAVAAPALSESAPSAYKTRVEPVLIEYCYDCHGDGMDKGKVAFDAFESEAARLGNRDLWLAVLRNLRADLMPPEHKPRPTPEQVAQIEQWIKGEVFQGDAADPDPGHVTLRRLNRIEYQNTIRDLMGIEFRAFEEFPPDDTGYGFDIIGDVLTVSPLLLEKYLQAAETIVQRAVPLITRLVPSQEWTGSDFAAGEGRATGERMNFYDPALVSRTFSVTQDGAYRIAVDAGVFGSFDFDPGRCRLTIKLGEETLWREEHKWQDRKHFLYEVTNHLAAGDYALSFELEPLVTERKPNTSVDLRLERVRLEGPLAEEHWRPPPNYGRFFHLETPPNSIVERREYAGAVLTRFARRAFRRPVDTALVDKLVALAEAAYQEPGKTFEAGVAKAMVAVLASPRFIFRVEDAQPATPTEGAPSRYSLVDEYGLASRLSYFLWSTMPDDELLELAERGELRQRLSAQVARMLADGRSQAFIRNFTGQWLQVRDIEGVSINERVVLARDAGRDREMERSFQRFIELRNIPDDQLTPEQEEELERLRALRRGMFRGPRVELDARLRKAMQRETEMHFEYVLKEDRAIVELLDSSYTFLNERLADHYGIPGVEGEEMRRVDLPSDSVRGGILTQGAVLVVTSNPTRTSPVKRGLFILDYILGTPAPPPPGDVPLLEEAEEQIKDHDPTLREALELHRSKPLCHSCHARMDPLGLALENFNALGMWRDKERGTDIDTAGRLITGERFQNVHELKHILVATDRRADFYRCLTEKLLTYAIGRGLDYYDVETVDQIVAGLERHGGKCSALIHGIIESAPFQKRRRTDGLTDRTRHVNPAALAQTSKEP